MLMRPSFFKSSSNPEFTKDKKISKKTIKQKTYQELKASLGYVVF